ncbi:MAG: hypothetical protein VX408_02285 [Pseudomonadota bacterium]|uniref:hypothetical protein n=1 Tax=Psychrobacter pacificensis TaxID=112002 RepID=UPI001CBF49C5|nr:hypothetical protein [Psychrobacter pacificensis]MBZ1393375.1 hypothetical protein [Psychrobacter pacificensis]MDE0844323.1 hypothetical protein [Psychrobacter pacificensis]MEC9443878.1 hypothetical protein [Pseudomonadota bacterium]MED6316249.1 hypothetical protein [Pseudomonadota bacterium]
MSPDIFIEDFELTENTEELHAILGRSLIISTRFDNLCDVAAKLLKFPIRFASLLSEDDYKKFIKSIFKKLSSLNNNINSLSIGQKEKDMLHIARKARNEVVHSLSIGMTGCLDIKIDECDVKTHISSLIAQIAAGDYLISAILSILNKEPLPNYTESQYKRKVVEWVLGN